MRQRFLDTLSTLLFVKDSIAPAVRFYIWVDMEERFRVGQSVLGTLERKEPFGWFVALEPGITGLVPKSRITDSAATGNLERLREGDRVKVLIETIQLQERRITLGLSDQREEAC